MFTNQPKKKKQLSIMVFSFQKYILEFHAARVYNDTNFTTLPNL